MYDEGERIEVRDPDGPGWIAAIFREVAEDKPRQVEHPGINKGASRPVDQAWVTYEEGERAGTGGLHTFGEMRRPPAD